MKKKLFILALIFIQLNNKMPLKASEMPCAGITNILISKASEYYNNADIIEEELDIIGCIEEEKEYIKLNSTAYYNKYNNKCSDGTYPKANHTLAGPISWRGKEVELYDKDKNYIGDYTFNDVGYGKSIGYGNSKLLKGKPLGDIEAGKCIDIFFDTKNECFEYGRRDIYIVWK